MKNQRITIPAKASPQATVSRKPELPLPRVLTQEEINTLFHQNLTAMAEFYRRLDGEGPSKGLYVIMEMLHRDMATAWDHATSGKKWAPPAMR